MEAVGVSDQAEGQKSTRAVRMKGAAKTEFDAWATSYDRSLLNHFLFRPSYLVLMEEIARWHKDHDRPFRVLDIGCGTGTLAGWVATSPLPATVVGLDYAPSMCVEADAKAGLAGTTESTRFVAADSEHLPFADGTFDIVTCSNSFHHYPHQDKVVCDMHRVLAPGGRLILIDGFRDNIIGYVTFDICIARVEGHVHHAPWPQIHQYFEDAGFRNIRRRKFNFWFPLMATIGEA
jgi:ubiquinone/menaquinone biosynthesis C-methylase UbiE